MWHLALAAQGQVRRAGMAGVICGFDMPAAFTLAEARGLDRAAVAALLPGIEIGMIAGIAKTTETDDGAD